MASKAKPPILAAPLEIRFEIYCHAWTTPRSDLHRLFDVLEQQGNPVPPYPQVLYFRLQVEKLHALVSICRQIRDEVLSEYFHQTQVRVSTRQECSCMCNEVQYLPYDEQDIRSSLLFVSNTQHVNLCWYWTAGESDFMTRILDWLLQLKQLKTLELLIKWPSRRMKSAPNKILDSSFFGRLTTLRNLEKIVVKLEHEFWLGTHEVQRIEDILSKSVREDFRQPEQQPTYAFENLIGYGTTYIGWPLPRRI